MLHSTGGYFRELGREFGEGWNRFWFAPSDPYSLGLIRMLTGALALAMHATLTPDVVRFFATGGWIPVEVVTQLTARGTQFSYLNSIGSPTELLAVHWLGIVVLALYTLGFYSRITSILALVVVLSDIHRGPMLTTQFEPVLTMVMAYLCLGPSGASWSIDRWRARRKLGPTSVALLDPPAHSFAATIAIRLIQVHLALLIATMGTSKLMGETWWTGMGAWWLATRPESRLVDVTSLSRYPINLWTHAIVLFELSFPILIWVPLARPLILAAGMIVWISIALLTGQVSFALMLVIASLSYCSAGWLRARSGALA